MAVLNLRCVRFFGRLQTRWLLLAFCLLALLPAAQAQIAFGRIGSKLVNRKVEISSSVAEGLLIDKSPPIYPAVAKAARVQGTVVLTAVISKYGIVEEVKVAGGPALLQQAAMESVRTWRYRPYEVNGEAVPVKTTINVNFSLGAYIAAPAVAAPAPAAEAVTASVAAEEEPVAPATPLAVSPEMVEYNAWRNASSAATLNSFREFYLKFPGSAHIKAVSATLRARYWFKLAVPFGDDGKHRDGVVVTIDGQSATKNLSLQEAEKLNVIGYAPAAPDANPDSQGRTFKRIYFEATEGGVLVGNQIITPKDFADAEIILSADGTQLLSWDLSRSTPEAQTTTQPTITEGPDGQFACAAACP